MHNHDSLELEEHLFTGNLQLDGWAMRNSERLQLLRSCVLLIFFLSLQMFGLHACLSPHLCFVLMKTRRDQIPLELGFQVFVSHHVGTGN